MSKKLDELIEKWKSNAEYENEFRSGWNSASAEITSDLVALKNTIFPPPYGGVEVPQCCPPSHLACFCDGQGVKE